MITSAMPSESSAVSCDCTPEYSIAVWAPRGDAQAIPLILAQCFGVNYFSLQQRPVMTVQHEAGYPLVAAASFVVSDDLTMQRVRHLSERLPRAAIQVSVAFVNSGTGSVASRVSVAYRNGREVHRFGEIGDEGGTLPRDWLERMAIRELESGYSYVLDPTSNMKTRANMNDHFEAHRALKSLLTDEERAACLIREADLRKEADDQALEIQRREAKCARC